MKANIMLALALCRSDHRCSDIKTVNRLRFL
uniref:Uncharacterized protein n=1 Tax=Anguilla anguilla TaxID=7936 RepID=A0A0E9QRD8_ANGAN